MSLDVKAVAFDLDGTLYPNYSLNFKLIPFILIHWRLLLAFGRARSIIRKEQEKSDFLPVPHFYRYQALVAAKLLRAPVKKTKEKIDRLMYRGWEPIFKTIKPFPHVVNTLTGLGKAGLKLGLLSDFPPETKLDYMGLSGIWEAILCSERSGAIKPHTKPFIELAKTLDVPPEKILYVGNSYKFDIVGAHRTGMKTALIKSPFAPAAPKQPKPDFTFYDYRQLYDFVLN